MGESSPFLELPVMIVLLEQLRQDRDRDVLRAAHPDGFEPPKYRCKPDPTPLPLPQAAWAGQHTPGEDDMGEGDHSEPPDAGRDPYAAERMAFEDEYQQAVSGGGGGGAGTDGAGAVGLAMPTDASAELAQADGPPEPGLGIEDSMAGLRVAAQELTVQD